MKVPPKRKGNGGFSESSLTVDAPSMKVPPKRKGNAATLIVGLIVFYTLNESPSEKEGKWMEEYAVSLEPGIPQ